MPSKGRQRASRQTQLKSKRRKGRARVVDSRPDGSKESATNLQPSNPSYSSTPPSPKIGVSQSPQRSQVPTSAATPLEYTYLPGEIRQIGIVASIVVLLLIAFTFIPLG